MALLGTQSSSATTSLVVTLVASSTLSVKQGIPIIMGTNIGTSLTSTIIALYNIKDKQMYRLGFSAAVLHDLFNWMTVLVLLPLEMLTSFLERSSSFLVSALFQDSITTETKTSFRFLEAILDPFLDSIVRLKPSLDLCFFNSTKSTSGASEVTPLLGNTSEENDFEENSSEENLSQDVTSFYNFDGDTFWDEAAGRNETELSDEANCSILLSDCDPSCRYLFADSDLADETIGVIILFSSLAIFIVSFAIMVRGLKAVVDGEFRSACLLRQISNTPTFFADLILIVSGFFVTFLIQSSSVVTSAIVPLVSSILDQIRFQNNPLQASSEAISLERAYAVTVGTNLGTTTTSILAALSLGSLQARFALQLALCHTIFNISGLVLFYPLPFMRWPLFVAKTLGSKVEKYKWFSVFYLILSFFLIPAAIYGLSLINTLLLYTVVTLFTSLTCLCILVTHLQLTKPHLLPEKLRDWSFLPRQLRSFEIIDYVVQTYMEVFCCCLVQRTVMLSPLRKDEVRGFLNINSFSNLRFVQYQQDKNVLQLGLGANLQLVRIKK